MSTSGRFHWWLIALACVAVCWPFAWSVLFYLLLLRFDFVMLGYVPLWVLIELMNYPMLAACLLHYRSRHEEALSAKEPSEPSEQRVNTFQVILLSIFFELVIVGWSLALLGYFSLNYLPA